MTLHENTRLVVSATILHSEIFDYLAVLAKENYLLYHVVHAVYVCT